MLKIQPMEVLMVLIWFRKLLKAIVWSGEFVHLEKSNQERSDRIIVINEG